MKKRLAAALAALLLLTGCGCQDGLSQVSQELGIDATGAAVVSSTDTHGWLGDGTSCLTLQFADGAVLEEIKRSGNWRALLDDTARELLYGVTYERDGEVYGRGPYLTDENGTPLVPEIQNGWYRLIDRRTDLAAELDGRVFNLTLGVYDADRNLLYVCKLDT